MFSHLSIANSKKQDFELNKTKQKKIYIPIAMAFSKGQKKKPYVKHLPINFFFWAIPC
jgi:hypothetical protein